jgi:hypothetical protein
MHSKPSKEPARSKQAVCFAGFLLGLFFVLEDWGDMFFQNVGLFPNCMALHLRTPYLS